MPVTTPPPPRLSGSRRTSFARRDSNLALLSALFAGVILAFALILLVVQRVNPELGSRVRGATADAMAPIISVARAPVEAGKHLGDNIRDYSNVVERNRELQAQLEKATQLANSASLLANEVDRLEKLIELRRPERRLIASGIASTTSANAGHRTAILSVGMSDGVLPRMPVLAANGLAGRVTDVGHNASRMMLLTDANSRVPVRVLRTGWTGLAVGTGGTLLEFQFDIASGTDHIKVGDRLITTGDGGLYPPGLPVAVIVDATSTPPKAKPLANPTGLGAVMVEAPWLPTPEFVVAPDAPSEADRPVTPAPAAMAPAQPAQASGAASRPSVASPVTAAPRP